MREPRCFKCDGPGYAKWRVCADGAPRWVCLDHDIELNRLALTWAYGRRRAGAMMARYLARIFGVAP